jgi:hypothetical protein
MAHPQRRAAMLGLDRQQKSFGGRVFRSAFRRERIVEVERAGGVFGRANVEQARKMGESVGHVRLLK